MNNSALLDYFNRLYIIHLPERVDRYKALRSELMPLGIDIEDPKVRIVDPPRPPEAKGFASVAVYSHFLSQLGILKEALQDRLENVWIFEDDAIFRTRLRQAAEQEKIVQQLTQNDWDICYLGHSIKKEALRNYPRGLISFPGAWKWTHCYCVHQRILPQLVKYLEETLENPPGHPRGGRMYFDGALSLFRRFHPEVVCLVSNPNLSHQKGSPSNLAEGNWYDRIGTTRFFMTAARAVRDELWRRGLGSGAR